LSPTHGTRRIEKRFRPANSQPSRTVTDQQQIYRLLQQHLDRQPVGFPATLSGADLRFLRRMLDAIRV
jgi:hypothetical protein